jgi:hypothetical protein
MTDQNNPVKSAGNGGYERRDVSAAPILYFLLSLVVAGLAITFFVDGIYRYLEKRSNAEQTPVSPLIVNPSADTRELPSEYKTYLKQNFPAPQLEVDERGQLDKIRIDEAQTLSSYDWIDQKAGTVRIPIDRAMDLLAQRGLPVAQGATGEADTTQRASSAKKASAGKTKGTTTK